jgi:hypothetical protein
MTNTEILQKAIEKAEKNGFLYPHASNADELVFYLDKDCVGLDGYFALIFNLQFAEAFFGVCKYENSKNYCHTHDSFKTHMEWYKHLAEMVLEKEPLKYLEKFLDE